MNTDKPKKIWITPPEQAPMQVDANGDTWRQMFGSAKEKKDWKVTLSYDVRHNDTYLIQNEREKDAIYIAENQNASPKYDCMCIKEDSWEYENEETTIKEVVWNSDKKDWLDKEKK
jgi:spore germination protein YaaH